MVDKNATGSVKHIPWVERPKIIFILFILHACLGFKISVRHVSEKNQLICRQCRFNTAYKFFFNRQGIYDIQIFLRLLTINAPIVGKEFVYYIVVSLFTSKLILFHI